MNVRPYQASDAGMLLALFKDTVRRVNSRDYDAEQIRAWASDDIDPDDWAARFDGRAAWVVEIAGMYVGFTDVEADGHIDRFFVAADWQGRGVGRLLMATIMAEATRRGWARLFTEASITARPFFEHMGFKVLAEQTVACRGAMLVNYRMECLT